MPEIEAVLGASGPLARALPAFKSRPLQQQMAARIAMALQARELLLIEAGTGTGKTFAYLVPALLADRRVLISTGTRTLQDQLFHRDLPLLSAALGRPARVALLKGRSNYLCRARLLDIGRQAELLSEAADSALGEVLSWSDASASGDLSELPTLGEEHPLRKQLSSTRDSCTGSRCSEFARCHVFAARRAALDADIVVINHHLLMADLALKEEGFGDLLPSADAIILDEAHQLPDLASEFFGVSFSSRQLELLVTDLRQLPGRKGEALHEGVRVLQAAVVATSRAIVRATTSAGADRSSAWSELSDDVHQQLAELGAALETVQRCLAPAAIETPEVPSGADGAAEASSKTQQSPLALEACAARAAGQLAALREIQAPPVAAARTLSSDARGFTLRSLPYDIAERFRSFVRQGPAWIFTSATLAVGEDFSHFATRLGLEDAATVRLASPFDYRQQALLYLPRQMPEPGDRAFTGALVRAALPLLAASDGGAFLLFTSHRALREAAEQLAPQLPPTTPVLVQGSAPRELLLRRFRASAHAVLLGSASFWEGVDVQGVALRLVIIDKLPFASPEDPVVRARIEHLQTQGGSAFRDYQLPEAVLTLKQGVGRLIRSEQDAGVVMIADPRLRARSYGRTFLGSLPPMPVTQDLDEACERLAALRPAS